MLFSIDAGKFNIAKQCGVHLQSLSRNCRIGESGVNKVSFVRSTENRVEWFGNDDAGVDRFDRTKPTLCAFDIGAAHADIGTQRFSRCSRRRREVHLESATSLGGIARSPMPWRSLRKRHTRWPSKRHGGVAIEFDLNRLRSIDEYGVVIEGDVTPPVERPALG